MSASDARHPLEDYLRHLRPYFDSVEIAHHGVHQWGGAPPEVLLTTRGRKQQLIRFALIKLPSNLTKDMAAATVSHALWLSGGAPPQVDRRRRIREARSRRPGKSLPGAKRLFLVLAPYISPQMGEYFRENNLQYLDRLGNCYLDLGVGPPTHVQAFKPPREATGTREFRAPGLQLIFALLVDPDLVTASVRVVAERAGVGKSTVATTFSELQHRGFLGRSATRRQLLEPDRLREEWLAAYARTLRRRLLIGRYDTPHPEPDEMEAAIERALGRGKGQQRLQWGWGGGAGAFRLTPYYHGEETVLHVQRGRMRQPRIGTVTLGDGGAVIAQVLKAAKAHASPAGRLIVLEALGPLSFESRVPRVVHPLLIVAELGASSDPRAHDAAREVRRRFLDGTTVR